MGGIPHAPDAIPTTKQLLGWLAELGACPDARKWCRAHYDPQNVYCIVDLIESEYLAWLAIDLNIPIQRAYDAALSEAVAAYGAAKHEAQAAYDAALDEPRAAHQSALSEAQAAYDAAKHEAVAAYDAALSEAVAAYSAAKHEAVAAYSAALFSPQFVDQVLAAWRRWRCSDDASE